MYSRPADPIPHARPSAAPFFVTHAGPRGPSITYGIRSLSAEAAFDVKRSGGSQHRSRWQSAEIISYRMAASLTAATTSGQVDRLDDVGRGLYGAGGRSEP